MGVQSGFYSGAAAHHDALADGERRILTVLIADIQGSTSIIENLDAEGARYFLDQVIFAMIEATHRFGGMVSQNLGDGILALFGAPVALEDHAERACRAGLAIQERIGAFSRENNFEQAVEIRIGIDSGEAITRTLQSDWTLHYSALGMPAHVAARLEKRARPGTILISARTKDLVRGLETRLLGTETVRGLSEPLGLFEVVGAHAKLYPPRRITPANDSEFIGREPELEWLLSFVAERSPANGTALSIRGEAGIGKSRLVQEFLRQLDQRSQRWISVRADPMGKAESGRIIRSILEQLIGIESTVDVTLKQQLRAAVTNLASDSMAFEPSILAWFDIIEHAYWNDLTPDARRIRMVNAAIKFINRAAAPPIVIVIEDLHNADALSLDVITALVRERMQIVVLTHRDNPDIPALDDQGIASLELRPLSGSDTYRLVTTQLGNDRAHQQLRHDIANRCNGNPLYVLESIRELIGRGLLEEQPAGYGLKQSIDTLPLPTNVHGVIASRVDRLSRPARVLLRAASILGKSFPLEHLAAISDEPTRDLPLAELLEAKFLIWDEGQPSHNIEFAHDMVRDVVYDSMLKVKRSALHRRATALYEGELAILDSHSLIVLAHHQLKAENWHRAFECWHLIAEQAVARAAQTDARYAVQRARDAIDKLGSSDAANSKQIALYLLEINTVFMSGKADEIAVLIENGLAFAELVRDDTARCKLLSRRASQHWLSGELQAAQQAAEQSFSLANTIGDVDLKVNGSFRLGVIANAAGRFAAAAEHLHLGINLVPTDRMFDRFGTMAIASSSMRAALARALGELNRLDDGRRWADEAFIIAGKNDHAFSMVYAAQEIALFYLRAGQISLAIDQLLYAKSAVERIRPAFLVTFFEAHLGYALALDGSMRDGIKMQKNAIEQMRKSGINAQLAQQIGFLAESYLLDGALDHAKTHAQEAYELAVQRGELADSLWIALLLTRIGHRIGQKLVEPSVQSIQRQAAERNMHTLANDCHRLLAKM